MNVRGERECRDCGNRWSYYETGAIECPQCESLRSVGVTERATHTDTPVTLELNAHRTRFGEARGTLPSEGVDELKRDLRRYVHKRGFINGGELRRLDSTYLAARELIEAVDVYDRLRDPTEFDQEYLLALLAGADEGDRPETTAVPDDMWEARGMAAARAVGEFREDALTFLDELVAGENAAAEPTGDSGRDETAEASSTVSVSTSGESAVDEANRVEPARDVLGRIRDQTKRLEALQGGVNPETADALVDAANAVGDYVRTGDPKALSRAADELDGLEP
ncbi:MAG: hypothetical protein A07HR67_02932 [uncultured archaeon A07HR67]|nr:MAG: hypothetical protein A07HR67_02932 [uncultured archaeon A07HR67]